jgi:hypothetical protein
MKVLEKCWRWFWQQSLLNKVAIIGLIGAAVPFFLPTVVSWFKPTLVKVGVAFYVYERAYSQEGNAKSYFYETRNLVSNCRLRRIEQPWPADRAKPPHPQSWVLGKFLIENVSDESITNLRVAIRTPVLRPTTELLTTANVDATGRLESGSPDARSTYMISITALPPNSSAVFSLKTPIDGTLRQFLYGDRRSVTVQVPFLSSDQFQSYPPIVSRTNAMSILNRENVLRIGDETFAGEAIGFTMLDLAEPDRSDENKTYLTLPKALVCPEGTAGDW